MFLVNLGYKWGPILANSPRGIILNASGIESAQALARNRDEFPDVVLFDPQLYLAALSSESALSRCVKLASYSWFPIELGEEEGRAERFAAQWPPEIRHEDVPTLVESAIQFQEDLGVSSLIIPSLLTVNPLADLREEFSLVDAGIAFAEATTDKPLFATFAVSDICFENQDPTRNLLLMTAIDQFTARPELVGVYLVINNTRGETNRIIDRTVARSILEFCNSVGLQGGKEIIVNYTDSFGLVCIAAGASSFASGIFQKDKRLCLDDFADSGFGRLFPKFYSHATLNEYLIQRDLMELRDNRLLRLLAPDETEASSNLFEVLRAGNSPEILPEWEERQNNIAGALAHYIELMDRVEQEFQAAGAEEKMQMALVWLQEAESHCAYIQTRLTDYQGDMRHIHVWRAAYEEFLGSNYPDLI